MKNTIIDNIKKTVVDKIMDVDGININPEMTDEHENAFINNIGVRFAARGAQVLKNPSEAHKLIKEIFVVAGEVQKFREVQETKRADIEKNKQIAIEIISSQKQILMEYLEKTFDERKNNFEMMFKIIDHALKNNNIQQLAIALDNINKLATSSPFKDLSSTQNIKNALKDKDHVWDI
jgi:hypothetical protein